MRPLLIAAALVLLASAVAPAAERGTVQRIKVHGQSLEGNLEGDSPDREVSVYLPPGYESAPARRYPVIYMLHGFTDSDELWMGLKKHWINLPAVIDKALAAGGLREMILVMPNAFTRCQGSMYSNSATTGDWEAFVARELVAYIDAHYRTVAAPESRGLAGHSMGGYGTIRIAMKYPGVFSSIYALSPCCLTPPEGQSAPPGSKAEAVRSFEDVATADFFTKALLASAAAWSPNPVKPPLYSDLPWDSSGFRPAIAAKWAANAPLAMLDQYMTSLRQLRAIAFDAGDKDAQIAATIRTFDRELNAYRLPHTFEIYPGDHVNRIAQRIETKMLPFFSTHLAASPSPGR